jgi:Arf-GAP/coiled-coil/ANK repeat/PH domain-containing protein
MTTEPLKPIIDLNECLLDSPKFRLVLEQNEIDLNEFEIKTDKVVKLCTNMVEIGKSFIKAKSNFINGIWDLLVYFKDDPALVKSLNRFVQTLTELLKYDSILIDQANRAVGKNLSNFIREDIFKVKETKRHFDKISDEYDSVLNRHSQIPRNKPNECEEATNLLTATRSCFQHLTLDYVTQLSVVKSKKRHEVLDSVCIKVLEFCIIF